MSPGVLSSILAHPVIRNWVETGDHQDDSWMNSPDDSGGYDPTQTTSATNSRGPQDAPMYGPTDESGPISSILGRFGPQTVDDSSQGAMATPPSIGSKYDQIAAALEQNRQETKKLLSGTPQRQGTSLKDLGIVLLGGLLGGRYGGADLAGGLYKGIEGEKDRQYSNATSDQQRKFQALGAERDSLMHELSTQQQADYHQSTLAQRAESLAQTGLYKQQQAQAVKSAQEDRLRQNTGAMESKIGSAKTAFAAESLARLHNSNIDALERRTGEDYSYLKLDPEAAKNSWYQGPTFQKMKDELHKELSNDWLRYLSSGTLKDTDIDAMMKIRDKFAKDHNIADPETLFPTLEPMKSLKEQVAKEHKAEWEEAFKFKKERASALDAKNLQNAANAIESLKIRAGLLDVARFNAAVGADREQAGKMLSARIAAKNDWEAATKASSVVASTLQSERKDIEKAISNSGGRATDAQQKRMDAIDSQLSYLAGTLSDAQGILGGMDIKLTMPPSIQKIRDTLTAKQKALGDISEMIGNNIAPVTPPPIGGPIGMQGGARPLPSGRGRKPIPGTGVRQ